MERKMPSAPSLCELILDIESESSQDESDALELAYECLRDAINISGGKKLDAMSGQYAAILRKAMDFKKTEPDSVLIPGNDGVIVEETTYEEFLKTVRDSGYELKSAVLSDGSRK